MIKTYRDDTNEKEKDTFDEYSTRDNPPLKSFYQRYGFDERDGPPEENDDEEDNEPWGKSDPRRWV